MAFLLTFTGAAHRSEQETLARRIAPSVLRFHVLADSDTRDDQALKLQVRSLILDKLHEALPPQSSKAEISRYILSNKTELEQNAELYLREQGCGDTVRLELGRFYFPQRFYALAANPASSETESSADADSGIISRQSFLCFPCGRYDALRVVIGSGKGHNWWCVLYPNLCFTDITHAAVPQTSAGQLQESLKKDDYLQLEERRPVIHFRFIPQLQFP